ncbi:MAG: TetR/AcrR family transcriptional regulator [Gammaproteobacteria bacterium]|nr:MAG: TetR/AcrR family transcriptional regulator [Gammaproteobacteria bacterium]
MNARLSREAIIDRAYDLADSEGLQALKLTRIANDLGVSQPALYRHVAGIQDLRMAIALRARDIMAQELARSISGLTGKEAFRALAHTWRLGASSHPALLMLPAEVKIKGNKALEAAIDRIVDIISDTLRELDLGEAERVHAARSLRSALHGFMAVQNSSGRPVEVFDDTFEQLITLLWVGLQAKRDRPVQTGSYNDSGSGAILEKPGPKKRSTALGAGGAAGDGAARLSPDAIVEVAANLADRHGLKAVSLTRIAKTLGVRQPALYRHVEGIEALWRALALRAHESLLSMITEATIGRARDQAIAAAAHAWRGYVRAHPGTYSSITRAMDIEDTDFQRSSTEVVRVLGLGLRGYGLSAGTTIHIAECIRSSLHGFCLLEKDSGHSGHHSVEESFQLLIGLLIAGIHGMAAAESLANDQKTRRRRVGRSRKA